MSQHPSISVSFEIEQRGDELFFRAMHQSDATWHGPYALEDLTATIAHYVGEDVVEAFLKQQNP